MIIEEVSISSSERQSTLDVGGHNLLRQIIPAKLESRRHAGAGLELERYGQRFFWLRRAGGSPPSSIRLSDSR